jgi:fumarate hydratase subunit beta
MIRLTTPLTREQVKDLKAGDQAFLSGTVYAARDQAHKRICAALAGGKKPPFDLKGQVIYYCGPTRALRGRIIGSCGPTTSRRMDEFTPFLLGKGLAAMIGKGGRSEQVRRALKKCRGLYFLTFAGCGALLSKYVYSAKVIAYPDLGPEAVLKLEVKDFPLIVAIDSKGNAILRG